jgi:hypothetical protein
LRQGRFTTDLALDSLIGRSVRASTLTKVVLSTVSARLWSLTYVIVGATTRKYCWHTLDMLPVPEINPGRVLNVAEASSGQRRTPVFGSVGQNSYGSMRHTWMLL